MNLLVLTDHSISAQVCFSETLANALAFACAIQQMDLRAVTLETIESADWIVLGLTHPNSRNARVLETLLHLRHKNNGAPRAFAIFQVQSRRDAPISFAYSFAVAKQLRQRGMTLLAKPIVFFSDAESFSAFEGELLRARQWLVRIARESFASEKNNDETSPQFP